MVRTLIVERSNDFFDGLLLVQKFIKEITIVHSMGIPLPDQEQKKVKKKRKKKNALDEYAKELDRYEEGCDPITSEELGE